MSQKFDWRYPGLEWSRFHSLANLLSLRNGGQAEPSVLSDIALEEDQKSDDEDERDDASIDTRFANQLSESGHERLKRKFLDCLAEIASNKKGGTAVSCAAMREAEDNVTVWVTRNDGFSAIDGTALIEIGECLSSLNVNGGRLFLQFIVEQMLSQLTSRPTGGSSVVGKVSRISAEPD